MARRLRVQYPGAIYHVSARMLGDARSVLFRDDRDRERYLKQLAARVEKFGVRLYAYVLMRNHVHLVIETPQANCSRFMHALSTAYTVYFNLRHGRHGHLFDGRFKGKLVEGGQGDTGQSGDYLLSLARYVHLNPVFIGSVRGLALEERVKILRAHRWSSYPGYIGLRPPDAFVDTGPLLAMMGRGAREQRRRFRDFVETGIAETDREFSDALVASPLSIGSDAFRQWVDEQHLLRLQRHARPEDVSFRHTTEPLPVSLVCERTAEAFGVEVADFRVRRRGSPLRPVLAHLLSTYCALTQREIAEALSLKTGAAVSWQQRRVPDLLRADHLRMRVRALETEFSTRQHSGPDPH